MVEGDQGEDFVHAAIRRRVSVGCVSLGGMVRLVGQASATLVVLALAVCAGAVDVTAESARCASIQDDGQRLACYDALHQPMAQDGAPGEMAPEYARMELLDLKTDIRSLRGAKVQAEGVVQMMGEMVLLKDSMMDMTPIMVKIERLPREQRRQLLRDCSTLCNGEFYGAVGVGPLGPELIADRFELR